MALGGRVTELFGIELPILQAPMAGSAGSELAVAVSEAGGLGSLPCAMQSTDQIRAAVGVIRQRTARPFNMNFFCHAVPPSDAVALAKWERRLAPYYAEYGAKPATSGGPARAPFDDTLCRLVEDVRPAVVSFHFGLPPSRLLARVKETGARIISSATTPAEADALQAAGCDAIIAQGIEAGGHRGMFLSEDVSTQFGTMALVPLIVDRVKVPVIASGGIADARGVAAAFTLGASGVQIGTAYLRCPEARPNAFHRAALENAGKSETVVTNVFTGRPARGIVNRAIREVGPMSGDAPAFPAAAGAIGPVRTAAEMQGKSDFTPLWAGQAAALARDEPAGDFTRRMAAEAGVLLRKIASA